jgi:hypothetical protein
LIKRENNVSFVKKVYHALCRLLFTEPLAQAVVVEESVQVIRTMSELDQMLNKLDAAQKVSDDELRKLFPTLRMEFSNNVPGDPYSDEYSRKQFEP